MKYNESSNGHEVEAKVSEELEITLSEARTAGYRWVTKSAGEPALQLMKEPAQPNTAGVGGAGHHLWQFRAVAAGTANIEFQYVRPWENSGDPARTFVLNVRVRS